MRRRRASTVAIIEKGKAVGEFASDVDAELVIDAIFGPIYFRLLKLDIALTLPPHKLPRELNMKELERYELWVAVGTTHPLAKSKFVSLNQMASEQSRH
jgi:DNA-binding transcriptional LysR family regulator